VIVRWYWGCVVPATSVGARRSASNVRSRGGRVGVLSPRVQVSEMQRARLLAAAAASIAESGYAGTSVANITSRARMSRRTFYDLFADREACLIAVMQGAVDQLTAEIVAADLSGLVWRERVRGGLLVILSFLDREPVLARVCVVQALQGGPRVLVWREEILAGLTTILDQGRSGSARARVCTTLTAEGLVGAVFAIVYARMSSRHPQEPLRSLLGELMGLIVLPYLGPEAAYREQQRSLPPLPPTAHIAGDNDRQTTVGADPLRDIPMRLTYRTARVLQAAGAYPGASNRDIGEHAGTYDQGQISKLLGRLQRLGLLQNTGKGQAQGESNAWSLTTLGERVTQQLALNTNHQPKKKGTA
jgi:AcrR family transcriptional regulator/DNA-binding MarR family transcriptional regulator